MVHLVLFSLPGSRLRLVQLAEAYNTLQATGAEVIAVPLGDADHIIRRLGGRPPMLFPVITDGTAEIAATYGLLSRDLGPRGAAAAPVHIEFLLDRQGYVRARWRPGAAGTGWDDLQILMDQILVLDRERPAGPAPDEHVH
jgi:putative copper resistance protein D